MTDRASEEAWALVGTALLLLNGAAMTDSNVEALTAYMSSEGGKLRPMAEEIARTPEYAAEVIVALAMHAAMTYMGHSLVVEEDPVELFRRLALDAAERRVNEDEEE